RGRGGHFAEAHSPAAQRAEQDRSFRLRRLGAGARAQLREHLGSLLRDAAVVSRPGRAGARRRPARGPPREGDVRLHRLLVVPPAAGGCARRMAAVRESGQHRSVNAPAPPERGEPAPPGGSWTLLYALVVIELLLVIALCGWLSRIGR